MSFTEVLHERIGHSMKEVPDEEAGFDAARSSRYMLRAVQVLFKGTK